MNEKGGHLIDNQSRGQIAFGVDQLGQAVDHDGVAGRVDVLGVGVVGQYQYARLLIERIFSD